MYVYVHFENNPNVRVRFSAPVLGREEIVRLREKAVLSEKGVERWKGILGQTHKEGPG